MPSVKRVKTEGRYLFRSPFLIPCIPLQFNHPQKVGEVLEMEREGTCEIDIFKEGERKTWKISHNWLKRQDTHLPKFNNNTSRILFFTEVGRYAFIKLGKSLQTGQSTRKADTSLRIEPKGMSISSLSLPNEEGAVLKAKLAWHVHDTCVMFFRHQCRSFNVCQRTQTDSLKVFNNSCLKRRFTGFEGKFVSYF